MMRIAENIRDRRIENGLTQQEIAEKLFVTRQCISRWEQGKTTPDIHSLEKLSLIYNCNIDELLDNKSLRDLALKSANKAENNRKLNYIALSLFFIILVVSIITITITLNRPYEEYHINAIITDINDTKSIFTVTEEHSFDEYTFDIREFKDVTYLSQVSNSIITSNQIELNDTVEIYFTKDITSKRITEIRVIDKYVEKNFMGIILVSNGEEYYNLDEIPNDLEGVRYYYLDDKREDTNLFNRHRIDDNIGSQDEKRINLEILYDKSEMINDIKVGLIYESGIEYVDSISDPMLRMPIYIGEHSYSENLYRLHSYELTIQLNFMPVDSFDSIEVYEYDEVNALVQSNTYHDYTTLTDHIINSNTLYAYIKTSTINQFSQKLEMFATTVLLGQSYEVYSTDSFGFVTIYTVVYK